MCWTNTVGHLLWRMCAFWPACVPSELLFWRVLCTSAFSDFCDLFGRVCPHAVHHWGYQQLPALLKHSEHVTQIQHRWSLIAWATGSCRTRENILMVFIMPAAFKVGNNEKGKTLLELAACMMLKEVIWCYLVERKKIFARGKISICFRGNCYSD